MCVCVCVCDCDCVCVCVLVLVLVLVSVCQCSVSGSVPLYACNIDNGQADSSWVGRANTGKRIIANGMKKSI